MADNSKMTASILRVLAWGSLLSVPLFGLGAFGAYTRATEFEEKQATVAEWPEVEATVVELDIETDYKGGSSGSGGNGVRRVGYARPRGRAGKAALLAMVIAANSESSSSSGSGARVYHKPIVRLSYEVDGTEHEITQPYLSPMTGQKSETDAEMHLAVFGSDKPLTVHVNPEDPTEAYAFAKRPPLSKDMDRGMVNIMAFMAVMSLFAYAGLDWARDRAVANAEPAVAPPRQQTSLEPAEDPYAGLSSARFMPNA